MEKITIYFKKEVLNSFNELVFDLFTKDYLSNLEHLLKTKQKTGGTTETMKKRKKEKKIFFFGMHFSSSYITIVN